MINCDMIWVHCADTLYRAMLARARGVRYGFVQPQNRAERQWAKNLTHAEAYSAGPQKINTFKVSRRGQ
jgi:hypothetical protein